MNFILQLALQYNVFLLIIWIQCYRDQFVKSNFAYIFHQTIIVTEKNHVYQQCTGYASAVRVLEMHFLAIWRPKFQKNVPYSAHHRGSLQR